MGVVLATLIQSVVVERVAVLTWLCLLAAELSYSSLSC